MINIIPFRGIRYNKNKVKDLNLVITAPYDKIDKKLQDEYYNRSEYNFVRLDLNKSEDRYDSSKRYFHSWIKDEILVREDKPCIYYYTQEYEFEGFSKVRKGFIALLKVDELENGNVLPHEQTLSGPKKDRLDLLTATEATFGQIFMLYSDKQNLIMKSISKIDKNTPIILVKDDDNNIHTVWKIDDPNLIKNIQNEMANKKVYIADGHHRYETSINYRNIRKNHSSNYTGEELFNYTMCTFINMDDTSGMSILPTHRFIKGLKNFNLNDFLDNLKKVFTISKHNNKNDLYKTLKNSIHSFGLITCKAKELYTINLRKDINIDDLFTKNYTKNMKSLDITILHSLVLENMLGIDEDKLRKKLNVDYFRDKEKAFNLISLGNYDLGFLVNPINIDQVKNITESGEKMPQKSTDFYPKLLSGLVVNYLS